MRVELKDSGVIFDEEKHTYKLGDKYLSGITSVLHRNLFPYEFDGIDEEILNKAAEYGTAVHKSIEDFESQWINDGTQEVSDYIQIIKDYNLSHEISEYTITDGDNYASNIDKVYRVSDDTFNLADLKTYGVMSPDKLEKAKWQLSIYAMMFEKQNPKAKVGRLFVIHIRNKQKSDGSYDHISELIEVKRIPSEVCKELLEADHNGEKFFNPYDLPLEISSQEDTIIELVQQKTIIEEQLNAIKSNILSQMERLDARSWVGKQMRLTRKLPTTRSTFDLKKFQSEHVDIDYTPYFKTSNVAGSLTIAI